MRSHRYMPPSQSGRRLLNGLPPDSEHLGELRICGSRLTKRTDRDNLILCKFRSAMSAALLVRQGAARTLVPAPLGLSIAGIVGVSAEEQVVRTGARRIIAPMQNKESVGDRAEMDLPGDSVSSDLLLVEDEASVPVTCLLPCPFPASVALTNARPIAVRKGMSGKLVAHRLPPVGGVMPRAVSAAPGYFASNNFTTVGWP